MTSPGERFVRHSSRTAAIGLLAVVLSFASSAWAEINGPGRVVDAGTIEIGSQLVRFYGVEAPPSAQVCERGGATWRCGQDAEWALAERIERHWVLCDEQPPDRAGIAQGVCYIGGRNGINLNAWLIENGWAMAKPEETSSYVALEQAAQRAGRGLWSGKFGAPSEWRRSP
jgi:endonuclease YncB( thermonuclease family)